MATDKKPSTQIKIGPAIGSYANIFEPRAIDEKQEPKYSISLLFEKSKEKVQLAELRKMIAFVAAQKFGPAWNKIPNFKNPIRDGDVEKPEHKEYAGKLFCNASSKNQPNIVDRHLKPVLDKEEAYSGCIFVASVNVFAFDKAGNKGVALGLNNLLVFAKGDRIDGRKSAAEDFADFVDEGNGTSAPAESADVNPLD
jgi:hypothetical protein